MLWIAAYIAIDWIAQILYTGPNIARNEEFRWDFERFLDKGFWYLERHCFFLEYKIENLELENQKELTLMNVKDV